MRPRINEVNTPEKAKPVLIFFLIRKYTQTKGSINQKIIRVISIISTKNYIPNVKSGKIEYDYNVAEIQLFKKLFMNNL